MVPPQRFGLVVQTVQSIACNSECSSRWKARLYFRSTFNNYISLIPSDHDSELAKGSKILTNPFSIAARSTVSVPQACKEHAKYLISDKRWTIKMDGLK